MDGTWTGGSGGRVVVVLSIVVVDTAVDGGLEEGAADCAGVSLEPQPATSATASRIAQSNLGIRRRSLIAGLDVAPAEIFPASVEQAAGERDGDATQAEAVANAVARDEFAHA